jgi:hypothetical protein
MAEDIDWLQTTTGSDEPWFSYAQTNDIISARDVSLWHIISRPKAKKVILVMELANVTNVKAAISQGLLFGKEKHFFSARSYVDYSWIVPPLLSEIEGKSPEEQWKIVKETRRKVTEQATNILFPDLTIAENHSS